MGHPLDGGPVLWEERGGRWAHSDPGKPGTLRGARLLLSVELPKDTESQSSHSREAQLHRAAFQVLTEQECKQTDRQKRSPESSGWWTETHCRWSWGGKQGQGGHGWGLWNSEWERLRTNVNRPPEDARAARLPCEPTAGSPASPGAYSAVLPGCSGCSCGRASSCVPSAGLSLPLPFIPAR